MALKIDKSLRFPESEFFPPATGKSGIAIHHTVGGSARSSFEWWKQDTTKTGGRRRGGTAYIIDRDGTALRRVPAFFFSYYGALPADFEGIVGHAAGPEGGGRVGINGDAPYQSAGSPRTSRCKGVAGSPAYHSVGHRKSLPINML